jgi:hypothetical protein
MKLKQNARERERRESDPVFRLKKWVRSAARRCLEMNGLTKNFRSAEVLGCDPEELLLHLNNNNRGLVYGMPGVVLHIDHIRPLASFNLLCRLDLLKVCNWNNLQLLTAEENGRKSDRFTPADAEAYALSVGGKAIAELEKGWRLAGVCGCEMCVQ